MHLVAPLMAGMTGAASGHVELYRRGTSTRATWYSDFEGASPNSSGANISLDSNGRAEVYVNEVVDVVVKNTSGSAVAAFTDAAVAAPGVEYQGQSFTGTDYETAGTGAGSGYPATMQAILNLWKDQNGAIDWKVLFNGAATTLQVALGNLAGLVFNVKNSAYGATGDGTTDDTTAIAAAITAATVAGGIVFFPAGTYRITSALSVPEDVALWGVGSTKSIITTDHASNVGVNFTTTGAYAMQYMVDLRIQSAQTNSGARVNLADGARVLIERCYITSDSGPPLNIAASTTTKYTVLDTVIVQTAATKSVVTQVSGANRARFERCHFLETNASYTPADTGAPMVQCRNADFVDCVFDASAATAGTFNYYYATSTTLDASFVGCRFLASGGATGTAFLLGTFATLSYFDDHGCFIGASITAYSLTAEAAGCVGSKIRLGSREGRELIVDSNAASYAADVLNYEHIRIRRTDATALNLTGGKIVPAGTKGTVTINVNHGGTTTPTYTDFAVVTTSAISSTKNRTIAYVGSSLYSGPSVLYNLVYAVYDTV